MPLAADGVRTIFLGAFLGAVVVSGFVIFVFEETYFSPLAIAALLAFNSSKTAPIFATCCGLLSVFGGGGGGGGPIPGGGGGGLIPGGGGGGGGGLIPGGGGGGGGLIPRIGGGGGGTNLGILLGGLTLYSFANFFP